MFVDGREVLEQMAPELEPLVPQFRLQLAAGQPHKVRVEWEPNSGYIALLHHDPRPEADRHSLTLSSEFAQGKDYYFVGGRNMDEVIAGYRWLTGKAPILPQMGLRLLAEPPADHAKIATRPGPARRRPRISQARPAAR